MSYYIFFTGLPKAYPQQGIRDLFSRCGNVVSIKLSSKSSFASSNSNMRNIAETLTQSGLIEYPDEASQQAAIALFNGYSVETPRGPVRIRVGASSGGGAGGAAGHRRGRENLSLSSSSASGAATSRFEKYIDSDLAYSENEFLAQQQRRHQLRHGDSGDAASPPAAGGRSGFAGLSGKRDPLQLALRSAPQSELCEAVEQLRVLCLEQPDKARILLDTFPQLRRSVCLILQKEKKLRIPLPPEAFVERKPVSQQQQQQQQQSATVGQDASVSNSNTNDDVNESANKNNNNNDDEGVIDEVEQQMLLHVIEELDKKGALEEFLVTDFECQEGKMDESERQRVIKLQRQLRAMGEDAA